MTKTILLAFAVALAFGGVSQAFAADTVDAPTKPTMKCDQKGEHWDKQMQACVPTTRPSQQ